MKKLTIEIEILNKFSFNVKDAPNLRHILAPPNNVGVYVLKKGEDVLYVGMSNALSNRISDHLRGSTEASETFYEEIDSFDVYITENNSYADLLETYLIMTHLPPYNTAKKPVDSIRFIDVETELIEIDEMISELLEYAEELNREYVTGFEGLLDDRYCIQHELKAVDKRIEELRKRRKVLRAFGAEPLENISNFANEENRLNGRLFWRIKQEELLQGERLSE